jgi:hypothetical protein
VSKATTQRDLLGRFLRLAEFGTDTPYEDLYQKAGGPDPERDGFIRSVVRRGYIELADDGTARLTRHGRQASRRLMHGAGL